MPDLNTHNGDSLPLRITHTQALALANAGAQLLDVRESEERLNGHAAHDTHIPLGNLNAHTAATLNTEHPVIAYCASGRRSQYAAAILRELGFSAYSLDGGFASWAQAGGQCLDPAAQ
ncbi:rhodanese-like domain-containing protein [Trueperella sp. LYQ141]|uniref:rhodanese-like domain-containing protein n=1 Tax=Trueperella sp. LYQ141 TaxID=3391058 RepID=UPI003982DD8B